jgi:putative membrane protein
MISAIVSAFHLLALAIGLPSVIRRGRELGGTLDAASFRRLLAADNLWDIAALLWIVTGILRAFGGLEKGTQFYVHSTLFWIKLGLFIALLSLESWPMLTFIKWRIELGMGQRPNTSRVRALRMINDVEVALVVGIVFVASFMARGFAIQMGTQ